VEERREMTDSGDSPYCKDCGRLAVQLVNGRCEECDQEDNERYQELMNENYTYVRISRKGKDGKAIWKKL
jgi:hypothetical protein